MAAPCVRAASPADLVVTTDQPPCDTEVLEEAMAALDVLCDPVVTEASRQALLLELGLELVRPVSLCLAHGWLREHSTPSAK